ncbi:MAG: YraN family protein [Sphaerochaetaceae bacterium]|nr:YraN family protein [Sphaerochaetaceae bacterium]
MDNIKRGTECEDLVCKYLLSSGYTVLKRNFRRPCGEIDIIAEKDSVLCAVEVKSVSRSWDIENLEYQISLSKRSRIKKTLSLYLAENADKKYDLIRFDAAAVKGAEVSYFEGVF